MVIILTVRDIFLPAVLFPRYLHLLLQILGACLGKLANSECVYCARIYKI